MILLSHYSYACASMALAFMAAAALAGAPKDHRRPMLLSGILSAPLALAAPTFVPVYWNPVRLFPYAVGIEDVVFSFSNGAMLWSLAH